jgi:hypothetical protein
MTIGPNPDPVTLQQDQLAARVEQLVVDVARLAQELGDLTAALEPASRVGPEPRQRAADPEAIVDQLSILNPEVLLNPESRLNPSSGDATAPGYAQLEDWVEMYFLPTFQRPFGGELRWCTVWKEHAEAIVRLQALWRSWEALRVEPRLGMITWLTSYLGPQLDALLARSGPFAQCTLDRHTTPTGHCMP